MLIGNYQGLASTIGGLGIQIEPDLDPRSRSSPRPRPGGV